MPMTTLTTTKHSKNPTAKKIAVIITAAGSSVRMGGIKKEFLSLNNGTVLSNCAVAFLKAFSTTPKISNEYESSCKIITPAQTEFFCELTNLVITIPDGMDEQAKKALFCDKDFVLPKNCTLNFVTGSSTRQKSIFNALQFLKKQPALQNDSQNKKHTTQNATNSTSIPDYVLIHDGARPFITPESIRAVTSAAIEFGASAPGFTPTDTIKQIDENGFIKNHLVRKELICIQTPQAFEYIRLYTAHENASKEDTEYTDDTEIWGKFVGKVKITQGDPQNLKITYPKDLTQANQSIQPKATTLPT